MSTEIAPAHGGRQSRVETTAATRSALLRSGMELLDEVGRDGVTLRAVGTRTGVSHSALYRHFADKDALLAAIAAAAWHDVADAVLALDPTERPEVLLRTTLDRFAALAQRSPDLYRLMFGGSGGDQSVVIEAAGRAHDAFLGLVGRMVPGDPAPIAGLLLAATHGIADLQQSGQLEPAKGHAQPADLLDLLIAMLHRQTTT